MLLSLRASPRSHLTVLASPYVDEHVIEGEEVIYTVLKILELAGRWRPLASLGTGYEGISSERNLPVCRLLDRMGPRLGHPVLGEDGGVRSIGEDVEVAIENIEV